MANVILKNLVKRFGAVTAVDNLSIEIQDKEFAVLVGPSGCGKTTALRMIAGLETITSGEIYIGDTLVNEMAPKDRDIAMVFQNYALYPHMNVRDNLGFGLKMREVPERGDRRPGSGGGRHPRHPGPARRGNPRSSRAASGSAWPWEGPSSASPRCFSSTSRSPTSTPSSGWRCGPRSASSTGGWGPRSSTSPTIRWRP